jgi:hypothetical protein
MITRLLRRFCSPEVEMLLKHLEENPEDFRSRNFSSNRTSRWELLAKDVARRGTLIEKRVLHNVEEKAFKKADRQRLLGEIVAQTVNPETVSQEEIEDGTAMLSQQYAQNLAQSMLNTKNAVQTGLMNSQLQNQVYGLGGAGVGGAISAQSAAQQQAMLNQYQNVAGQAQSLSLQGVTSTSTKYLSP